MRPKCAYFGMRKGQMYKRILSKTLIALCKKVYRPLAVEQVANLFAPAKAVHSGCKNRLATCSTGSPPPCLLLIRGPDPFALPQMPDNTQPRAPPAAGRAE